MYDRAWLSRDVCASVRRLATALPTSEVIQAILGVALIPNVSVQRHMNNYSESYSDAFSKFSHLKSITFGVPA